MNKSARVYRLEWRDFHDDPRDPPTVMVRVCYDPATHDLAFIGFELQAAIHSLLATIQEAHSAQQGQEREPPKRQGRQEEPRREP